MSYEIIIDRQPVFNDEKVNDMFKQLGGIPTVDLKIDFITKEIYQMFVLKILSQYCKQIAPIVTYQHTRMRVLEKFMEKHTEFTEELQQILNSLDANVIKNDIMTYVLSLPELKNIN